MQLDLNQLAIYLIVLLFKCPNRKNRENFLYEVFPYILLYYAVYFLLICQTYCSDIIVV